MSQPGIVGWQECGTRARTGAGSRASGARRMSLGRADLAFNNLEFSAPDPQAIKTCDDEEQVQHEGFDSYFPYACKEPLAAFAGRPEWQASRDHELRPHPPFLCEKNKAAPAYLRTYGAATREWVGAQMKNASVTRPDCKLGKT